MVFIYCIEDVNGLKYIGSTKKTLESRLYNHRYFKDCTSRLLDLDNCKIYSLEECTEDNRKVREQYWIDNTECVNLYNTTFDRKQYNKDKHKDNKKKHYIKHKDKILQWQKEYYNENKDKLIQDQLKSYHLKNSWGGDPRNHNNLLKIDPNIFL